MYSVYKERDIRNIPQNLFNIVHLTELKYLHPRAFDL